MHLHRELVQQEFQPPLRVLVGRSHRRRSHPRVEGRLAALAARERDRSAPPRLLLSLLAPLPRLRRRLLPVQFLHRQSALQQQRCRQRWRAVVALARVQALVRHPRHQLGPQAQSQLRAPAAVAAVAAAATSTCPTCRPRLSASCWRPTWTSGRRCPTSSAATSCRPTPATPASSWAPATCSRTRRCGPPHPPPPSTTPPSSGRASSVSPAASATAISLRIC